VYHHGQNFAEHRWQWIPIGLTAALFLFTIIGSWLHRDYKGSRLSGKHVGVVIPIYNEDPKMLMLCLESLIKQTRPPDSIWIIDDGSTNADCYNAATKFKLDHKETDIRVIHKENSGKREAQKKAFDLCPADVWITVDSDTQLESTAIENILGPFEDPEVGAVAGRLHGFNWDTNWLTRIIDIEFTGSFVTGRASSSVIGSVVVTCGGLAAYRGDLIMNNLDDYMNETFMGKKVMAGDDRRLTQYALKDYGRAVYQNSAVGWTLLPERWSHLIRQRVRWSASWYRGTAWCLWNLSPKQPAWWLVLVQAIAFLIFTFSLPYIVFKSAFIGIGLFLFYTVWSIMLSMIRAMKLLTVERADMSTKQIMLSVLLAPAVSVLYFFVLNPIRWYSLIKVFELDWSTRQEVEVKA
jgi:hyaluronan synthase